MKKTLATLASLVFSSTPALAAYVDGTQLSGWLKSDETLTNGSGANKGYEAGSAAGYVIGTVDAADGQYVCVPKRVKVGQLMAMTNKYLTDILKTGTTTLRLWLF